MKTLVGNIRVSVTELASDVYQYGKYLRSNFSRSDLAQDGDEDNAGGDMRLQVKDSGWLTHHGDSQFDQDHRGNWGSAFVPYGCTRKESLDIARQLIDEAQESEAMSKE